MPISCEIVSRHDISGALYTVNPLAINSTVPVFQENKRCIVELESKEFGRVVLVGNPSSTFAILTSLLIVLPKLQLLVQQWLARWRFG